MADTPYTFRMCQLLLRILCELVTICPQSDLETLKVTWRNQENGIDRATLLLIFQGRSYRLNLASLIPPLSTEPRPAVCARTFCDDGNVLSLYCPV